MDDPTDRRPPDGPDCPDCPGSSAAARVQAAAESLFAAFGDLAKSAAAAGRVSAALAEIVGTAKAARGINATVAGTEVHEVTLSFATVADAGRFFAVAAHLLTPDPAAPSYIGRLLEGST